MSELSIAGINSESKNRYSSNLSGCGTTSESSQISNAFHFWNGDEYTGQFAVNKDKQKITMQGRGVYTTSDGQTYEGTWEDDRLTDECKIIFPNEITFTGNLDDMVIQGPGKYKFKENVEIDGEFVSNNIISKVYLTDPNRNLWIGQVDKNFASVNFYPLHPFWQSVLNLQSKAVQLFYNDAAEENVNIWEENY